MKHLLASLTFAIIVAGPAFAQQVAFPDSASQAATESWLALVDEEEYAQSWEAAAPHFQSVVTADQWTQAAAHARGPLGALQGRTTTSVQAVDQLPNMPRANYLVVEYTSQFAQLPRAVETHVLVQGDDDLWRTVGYFVRPAQ